MNNVGLLIIGILCGVVLTSIFYEGKELLPYFTGSSYEDLLEQSPIQTLTIQKNTSYNTNRLENIGTGKTIVSILIPKQSTYYLDVSSLPSTVQKLTLRGTYKNPDIVIRDEPLYLTGLSQLTGLKELMITDFPLKEFDLTQLPLNLQKFEFFNTRVVNLVTGDNINDIPYVHILINGPEQYYFSKN